MATTNPIGLDGIEFVEFTGPDTDMLRKLFWAFGFSKTMKHRTKQIELFRQGDIQILVNGEKASFAEKFHNLHGPSLSSMGWRVQNAQKALEAAVARGAKAAKTGDYLDAQGNPVPAIYGIGESLIYFIDRYQTESPYSRMQFIPHPQAQNQPDKGFTVIDHLTNNVPQGTMNQWSDFYKNIFGFTEVRYFDIKGAKTGLQSYALRSACGKFCIPINEGTEAKSQINEYLEEYKGAGVQHLAFATRDIVNSLRALEGSPIKTLDIDDQYYREVFDRVPNVTEDHKTLQKYNILVDGDDEGYLLQIFTKNLVGPIFIEIIQRKNHLSFGEGNFGALFRSIERDQEKRGYL
jgi:4-hydroxyphenylpyruvate dioxygenase